MPNGNRLNRCRPNGVMNVVSREDSLARAVGICQKPELASILRIDGPLQSVQGFVQACDIGTRLSSHTIPWALPRQGCSKRSGRSGNGRTSFDHLSANYVDAHAQMQLLSALVLLRVESRLILVVIC